MQNIALTLKGTGERLFWSHIVWAQKHGFGVPQIMCSNIEVVTQLLKSRHSHYVSGDISEVGHSKGKL